MATNVNVPILGAKPAVTLKDTFEKRREAFTKEVDAIGDKYQLGIAPKITVTADGITPMLTFVDRNTPPRAPQKTPNKKES